MLLETARGGGVDENGENDEFATCPLKQGCGFFAYSWKLPAYSGAFLLTVDNFGFCTYSWSFFPYSFSFFTYSWSFLAYSGKVRLIRALRDCKQRSLTVSKKAPTVSKKASPLKQGLRSSDPRRPCICALLRSFAQGEKKAHQHKVLALMRQGRALYGPMPVKTETFREL